jgi:two-component system, cell cycle response regulator
VEDSGARTGNPRDAWGTITEHDLTEGASMRILIAEDSLTQAEDLRRRLESLGHKVTVAGNGLQAWEILQARPVRVAILDWLMPQMNGVDLCRLIRGEKNLHYVYLILLTSKDHRHERLQGLRAGADEFLSKPVDTHDLEVALMTAERIIAAQNAMAARIGELEQANEQLARLVLQDELTGLANLRGFQQALTHAFRHAIEDRLPLSLIRLELDHPHQVFSEMEPVNETEFLMELANRLRDASRDCDVPARVSAYGFAVILPGVSTDGALSRADCLRDAVTVRASTTVPITASVAAVTTTAENRASTTERLLEAAERAIGQARAEGGNRLILVEPPLDAAGALSPA